MKDIANQKHTDMIITVLLLMSMEYVVMVRKMLIMDIIGVAVFLAVLVIADLYNQRALQLLVPGVPAAKKQHCMEGTAPTSVQHL